MARSIGRAKLNILETLRNLDLESNPRPSIARGFTDPSISSLLIPAPGPSHIRGRGRAFIFDTEPNEASNSVQKSPKKLEPNKYSKPVLEDNDDNRKTDIKPNKYELKENDEPVTKLGKTGHAVDISANYLRLTVDKNHGAFEYRVSFIPDIEHKAFKIKMLKEHSEKLGKDLTFDGTTLYLPQVLNDDLMTLNSTHPTERTPVTLKLKFITKKDLKHMMQIFNILFKRIMVTLNHVKIGRECYNLEKSLSIPQHKLKLLPGYVTAVSVYEDGLMLNLDPLHKVVRTQTVLSEIYDITHNCQNLENAVKNCLVGKAVLTQYNGKLYTVDDVDFTRNPLSEFSLWNGESISFLNYYKKNYGKEIIDLKQPLLISRHLKRKTNPKVDDKFDEQLICLVPELCNMTGLSDEMRDNHNLMKDLSSHMQVTPNQRYQALKDYVDLVNSNERAKKMLENWGLRIDPLPVTLSGRELKPEDVCFGHSKIISASKEADWNKGALLNPVITPIDINSWVIIFTQRNAQHVKDFSECILRCSQLAGIKIGPPKLLKLQTDKIDAYVNTLKKEINQYLQLVVCICPNSRDDRYAAIKKICCVDSPIPSQVINGFTLSKPQKLRSIAHKILLQINCKLGGTLWSVPIPYSKLMVVGLDVYHSKLLDSQSVCGFVASYNQSLTRWYSRACFQRPGQEMVDQLKICFIDAIKLYLDTNGYLPDRIIVYRDGVGDGQFNVVKEYEIAQMKSCFEVIDSEYSPMFTFIVVQKRNNTRIFTTPSRNSNCNNPNPGTIIDNTITRRFLYDFYVVSHKTRMGSLVPTHYIVLHDTSTMEPDHVQRLTFKMCHLYFNWPGTVRVPAPCQYAHKLAFLIGSSVKKEHDLCLADKLFFL